MKHTPITKQKSPWVFHPDEPLPFHSRRVGDGTLRALALEEPAGWHLSISFVNHRGEPSRYPTWDEQVHAVRELLPDQLTYGSFIPPDSEYVALHDSTFHWHEHPAREMP